MYLEMMIQIKLNRGLYIMKQKNSFTLIELLVVIAIIAILAGILLPVLTTVRQKGDETKAKTQINALLTAIKSYETTYGVLPWGGGSDVVWNGDSNEDGYFDTLLQFLTKVDMTAGDAASLDISTGNTRNTVFLDAPNDFATKGYVDPWENRYAVALDLNYDGAVTINGTALNGSVFIYSFGPNGTDDNGSGDDICSWK